jgi:hypothetical protein
MAKALKKSRAIFLRKQGKSYSQIKNELGVSKSTLSFWLADMPLSRQRINELRSNSEIRIERYRNTMREKKEKRLEKAYELAKIDISLLSKREIILCGLFLYWGEGEKSLQPSVALSNTDPIMLRFYLEWLKALDVPLTDLKLVLHLYADMEEAKAIDFWSKSLNLPKIYFRKSYVKKSSLIGLSYKNGFGHGTCMIRYGSQKLKNKIMMSLKYLGGLYA